MYRCEAVSVAGFVQQLAVAYIQNGYWFYVTSQIPEGKDPYDIDKKIIKKYGADRSQWERSRRKRAGKANVQYLRFQRFFLIVATSGEHLFFEEEPFKDVRREPIKFAGYAIGFREGSDGRWHVSVRIQRDEYLRLKAWMLELACWRSVEVLSEEFHRLFFEPYAPVRRQLLNILRSVNNARGAAGLEKLPFSCLRFRRKPVKPFEHKREAA